MDKIFGITFAPFASRGSLTGEAGKESLRALVERTHSNSIILAPAGVQEHPQSVTIDYRSEHTLSDEELEDTVRYAKSLGLRVIMKPTVNCLNGTWRAHINFFDEDVPCEPKWSEWFAAYTDFQLHYAALSEKWGCDMFIPGCEMVNSERRETEWRQLIADLRRVYHGPISYNTDKYQEHRVQWWDCLDVISSSGYYPLGDWENQLDRIEKVVHKFHKPFFFAEMGCMSVERSYTVPNDWGFPGGWDPKGQADWYRDMFAACEKRDWVDGMILWSWTEKLYAREEVETRKDYDIYLKPAEAVVKENFDRMKQQ